MRQSNKNKIAIMLLLALASAVLALEVNTVRGFFFCLFIGYCAMLISWAIWQSDASAEQPQQEDLQEVDRYRNAA